ncbi:Apolipoprotein N-acyltransferase [Rickettsia prowazekii str. GvF12]|nr:Apolipoprotein N-acyltransferase [Rickettsia prowazekii str. GvF12]
MPDTILYIESCSSGTITATFFGSAQTRVVINKTKEKKRIFEKY